MEAGAVRPRVAKSSSRPATPARRSSRSAATRRSRRRTSPGSSRSPVPRASASRSSGPRGRWSRASSTPSRPQASPASGPTTARRAARGQQAVHQGIPGPPRHPDGALRRVHARDLRPGRHPRTAPADRRQGGRPRRRQGRDHRRQRRGGDPRGRGHVRGRLRRRGPRGRRRGVPRGRGSELHRHGGRQARARRSRPRRTTSAFGTATRDRTRAAWAPTRPRPSSRRRCTTRIMREVIAPTLAGLAAEGMPYTGFLYAGLMIAKDGTPNVLEFNCRFGDPETQPVLARLRSDLVTLVEAALAGRLDAVAGGVGPARGARRRARGRGLPGRSAHGRSDRRARRSREAARQGLSRGDTPVTSAVASSPPAGACCARSGSATASRRRSARPTNSSTAFAGMECSAAAI